MTHEDYKSMIPAQALGALEAGEARLFDEHLDECRECRAELADITDTVALLALDAAPVEPPDAIRDRILDFAKSTAPSGRPTRDERPPNVTSIARPRTVDSVPARPTSSTARWLAIAATIAFVAAAVGLFVVWRRDQQQQAEMARLREQLRQTEQRLTKEEQLSKTFASPDTRITELKGMENAPGATAKFAIDMKTGQALLLAYNLPAPPPGKEYQMWYFVDGKPMPGAAFGTDAGGRAESHEVVPVEGRNAPAFAITLEPAGGLPAPSGQVYMKTPA